MMKRFHTWFHFKTGTNERSRRSVGYKSSDFEKIVAGEVCGDIKESVKQSLIYYSNRHFISWFVQTLSTSQAEFPMLPLLFIALVGHQMSV
jgi:hypothetical protein